jgi:hypothetical protein
VAILEYAAQERVMAQYLYEHAGVPTDGTNGTYAHVALPGALLINTDAKTLYQNTGTQASPTWTERSAASGGGSGPQVSDPVTISSADLLALDTVRKEALAAPGVGLVRLPLWTAYRVVPGSNAYAIAPGEGIAMRYGSGSAVAGPFLDGEVPLGSAVPFLVMNVGTGYGAALSEFENQPITLVATAPITAGNGHLVLRVGYQDVPVA